MEEMPLWYWSDDRYAVVDEDGAFRELEVAVEWKMTSMKSQTDG